MRCGRSGGTGVLSPGSTVTLRVCTVGLRPEVPVVRLWGLLGDRRADYVRLRRKIQAAAGPRLAAAPQPTDLVAGGVELCTGDLGLVEVVGLWYRCCVVSRCGQDYRVFLLDEGCMVVTSAYYLARGCEELFRLPPEVLGCIVADIVPFGSPGVAACGDAPFSNWTVEAMEFLSFLHGKEMSGRVQEVVTPQLIVLELPQLAAQMHHLGLARRVTPSWFCQLLKQCLAYGHPRNHLQVQPSACSFVSSAVPQLPHVLLSYQPVSPPLDYVYPQLQLDVTEPVLVTHVSDPHHFYCQLKSLSQEICCLSDTMHHTYKSCSCLPLPKVGSPCAARGRDGKWYRALLLELIAGKKNQQVALVIFVDYGRKETVTRANLCHLPPECFHVPVVTYACALQGISDGGCGWSPLQISKLKALALGKGVNAHIKAFSSFEHLYYVNLYGENGINLNYVFGLQACCLVSSCTQVSQTEGREQLEVEESTAELELPPGAPPIALAHGDLASAPIVDVHVNLGAFYDAQVSHLRDPSEFWLQLHEHRRLFGQLKQCMWDFYSHDMKLDGAGWDLQPGSLCCASGKEGVFYRAVITRVLDSGVEVYLVDRGNRETVRRCAVKELLPRFRELPALALKCCLADICPLRGSWSEASVSAFREIVLNKGLKVHFLSVQGDKYMVEIFDQSQLGEKSVSKLMAQGGYAEYQRCAIPESVQKSPHMAVSLASCAGEENQIKAEKRLGEESDLKRSNRALNSYAAVVVRGSPVAAIHNSASSESLPAQKCEDKENLPISCTQNYDKMKLSSSYGCQLEVGTTVNVVVSYVENPGYFWCQLSKNCQDLKLLMSEIQEYCENSSHPHAWPNSLCLAQYSEDEKWYRALIISEVPSAEKVEVIYVDYGNRELVSLANLRSTHKRFLKLEAQAFRCSLYNLIQPNGQDPFAWDEEAIRAFQEFIDTSSSHLELKCTIFALASISKELFNIVDLMTPFQSACQFLTERGVARPLSPQKPLSSLVHLHSYYYSMHGIKIGNEEDIYITHVEDPWTFYCQLERCADVLAQLTYNIGRLSETMTSLETLEKSESLCLAKYTDNHWYRGIIMKRKPDMEVFFVDFGNTETIDKDNLLPLPSDACDILLLPMQAIKCSLSDISYVPEEATAWFKQAVLERQLKAIIVARESDGKLLVELFDGSTQINAKLKELSLINNTGIGPVENETLCSRSTDVIERNESAESSLDAGRSLERKISRSEAQREGGDNKRHFKKEYENLSQPAAKGDQAAGLLESDQVISSKKDASLLNKTGKESLLSIQMDTQSDIKCYAEGGSIVLKNISDLLQQKIVPGLKVSVYVSHVNDPLDFYVQLESDEAQLNSISESLNNRTQTKNPCGQLFQVGDLISAVYSEDSLWYRAVVKEKTSDNLISIQYIDYGNTSVINVGQAHRLPEDLSSIPAISIHCFLGGLKCKENIDWAEKAMLYFTNRTSEVLLTCEFVEKVKDKWEVILSDHEGIITVDLADDNLASSERSCSTEILDKRENSDITTACEPFPPQAQNKMSCVGNCKSFIWKFPEAGQTVKIYVTVGNGPEYFWSCSADTEDMKYIEEKIEEAENTGLNSLNDCRACIKSGDICLAKYSQDGKFYRAKVSSVEGDSVVVRHVDYGSEETISMELVRQIPCELIQVPNQAFACCLSGFNSSEGSWLSEAKEKFYDMTQDVLLEAKVIETQECKASKVPLSVVKLEASGKSINEEMKSFWKANKGTGDKAFSDLENPLKENRCSKNDTGLCPEGETPVVCGLAQEESESALLCSEPFLGVTSECFNTVETSTSVGAVEHTSGKADDGCETAEHQSNFDKDTPLAGEDSDNNVLLEPVRSYRLHVTQSEMKAEEQELSEKTFQEDAELKELTGSASAAEELQREPVLQSSSSDETEILEELDQLQTQCSYDDLKELILELEALSAQPFFAEVTKEAVETESFETQTASGDKVREKVLEQESFELPVMSEEIEDLAALNFLELLPSLNKGENSVPSVSNGENTVELIASGVQLSLGEKAEKPELNLAGIHKADSLQEDWMEVEPPPLKLSSPDGRSEKQLDLKTHDMLSVLGAEIEQLLELVLPDAHPSQEDGDEDLVRLEHTALQSSANSGSQFSCLTEDLMNQRSVCTVKSCDRKVEKHKEWQKKKDDCYVEEWMKRDLADSFTECGNAHVRYSACEPGDEDVEKKQNEKLAACDAGHNEYTCHLKGFAVGSKCVVRTSLKWCEARILEVSEKGTRVLNLSSGNEEIVDPENVWNGVPDWAYRSSEAITPVTGNLQFLPEESLLQEKQSGYSSHLVEDPHLLQHC
ncbi:LOW QUALITY PROTEIN: tudor domain-containing protein 6 [Strigops habroptila]|uniref:LOW QUALITY PROTEIN: tudor domain-containing protein 6 n=1 Tax=Strigops habroptila TaxID=2489341 RepID=UPI0011CF4CC3|nr:LOW QUALITY PROTEIN: tudor domain-containing protein 6 [Strigops habroptila]